MVMLKCPLGLGLAWLDSYVVALLRIVKPQPKQSIKLSSIFTLDNLPQEILRGNAIFGPYFFKTMIRHEGMTI